MILLPIENLPGCETGSLFGYLLKIKIVLPEVQKTSLELPDKSLEIEAQILARFPIPADLSTPVSLPLPPTPYPR
jgi:hypothetical protein